MSTVTMPYPRIHTENKINIDSYIISFNKYVSRNLKENFNLKSSTFRFDSGVIIKFEFVREEVADVFHGSFSTLQQAMEQADLEIEDKNGRIVDNFILSGTHIFIVENKIFLIKELIEKEWTEKQAKIDSSKIISAQ